MAVLARSMPTSRSRDQTPRDGAFDLSDVIATFASGSAGSASDYVAGERGHGKTRVPSPRHSLVIAHTQSSEDAFDNGGPTDRSQSRSTEHFLGKKLPDPNPGVGLQVQLKRFL